MIQYKVMTNDLRSLYRGDQYEIGKWYNEPRIGQDGANGCAIGLYAGPIESLLYRGVWRGGESVYRCECEGQCVKQSPVKVCWERMRIVGRMSPGQVRALARRHHDRLGYSLAECLYPLNPLAIDRPRTKPTRREIALVNRWDSAWASVWASVWASAWASVWASVRAYIGSLFPRVESWKYANHEPGVYPFKPAVDLWRAGLVPSHNGKTWRLHAGPDARIVWEGP